MGLFEKFTFFRVGKKPSDRKDLPITEKKDELVTQLDASAITGIGQMAQFRQITTDRETLYNAYDDMRIDPVIAAALEIYADDATQYDEQGRIIWVESEYEDVAKAGNRLLDILEIPERAWKHIYQACCYGDYYLKLYRMDETEEDEDTSKITGKTHVINDVTDYKGHREIPNYEEYVEDVDDPATMFDLRKRGKTAGFIQVHKTETSTVYNPMTINANFTYSLQDIDVYRPDRFVHISLGENVNRNPETVTIDLGDGKSVTYDSSRGKSILQDAYPVQKELQLLEDTLLLNRLTRSPLIRLLEIELGDMPKKEVNDYLRRIKNLIEQKISMDKDTGSYKSFNAPGPIDNVLYIPVRNGKGSISVNNLGGDVNIRDIADIDYFSNKRAAALKVPRQYLGDDMTGTGLDSGGSLTRLSIRYARSVKRIQTSYIRAITTLLNLFFLDKKLDYVNKFQVRMTSPSTQEDLERNELIQGNIDLVSNIMDLTESLEGGTQKKILTHLMTTIMKMPELAEMVEDDQTPSEEIDIEGSAGGHTSLPSGPVEGTSDLTAEFEGPEETSSSPEGGFTPEDVSAFEDEL